MTARVPRSTLVREERIAHYRRHRNAVGEKMLRAVLRSNATVEAAQNTNDALERMGMFDLSVSIEEVRQYAETTLRAEIASILAQHAYVPPSAQSALVARIVARMVPTRDDSGTGARIPRSTARDVARHEELEGALRREAQNLERRR